MSYRGLFTTLVIISTFINIASVFNKKFYIVPIGIFVLTYIWDFIKYIVERDLNGMDIASIIIIPTTWAIIYSALCMLGILIGFLLYIAFKKENK